MAFMPRWCLSPSSADFVGDACRKFRPNHYMDELEQERDCLDNVEYYVFHKAIRDCKGTPGSDDILFWERAFQLIGMYMCEASVNAGAE